MGETEWNDDEGIHRCEMYVSLYYLDMKGFWARSLVTKLGKIRRETLYIIRGLWMALRAFYPFDSSSTSRSTTMGYFMGPIFDMAVGLILSLIHI